MNRITLLALFFNLNVCFAQSSFEDKVSTLMDKYEAVGLSVVAVNKGEIVYSHSFGKKSLESGLELQEDDIFRIASISKSFSATAIMQLVEQKKISLDNDVSQLIGFEVRNPKFSDVPITLKMLLSHTSSINDSEGYFTLDAINPSKNQSSSKCYNSYKPGTDYQYCNLNFNLIGTIIEKVSGQRFDQYIVKNILIPLELYGGYCVDSLDNSKFVSLYNFDKEKDTFVLSLDAYNPRRNVIENYVMGYSTPIFSPTGGMKVSALDLAKYMMMHMNYGSLDDVKIISKMSSKLMQKPVNKPAAYGLALLKTDDFIEGVDLIGHTGSAYGLYSVMFFNPKKKNGVVAITNGCKNCSGEDYNNFLKEVSALLYKEWIKN